MATLTIPGDVNYDCLIGQSASSTIDTYAVSNGSQLLIDTDTHYCCSHNGASTANNGSFDTVSAGMVGKVTLDGTKAKMIPYLAGSGTAPNLFTGLAISSLTYSANVVTCTTAAHGLTVGTNVSIRIGGVVGATTTQGYNGVFTGLVTSATVIIYYLAANPGAATVTNARMVYYNKVLQPTGSTITITAASTTGAAAPWIATITTNTAHGFSVGDFITIAGVTPAGYNGNWHVMTTPSSTQFTIWMNATQTAGSAFGTAQENVFGYLLGWFANYITPPIPTGVIGTATIPAAGFCKIKNLTGGSFVPGTFTAEGGTSQTATACDHEYPAWIELVAPLTGTCTIPRTARLESVGDWHYMRTVPVAISTASWSTNVVTFTTAAAHGLLPGYTATISGVTPSAYNGDYTVVSVPSGTGVTFTASLLSNPGTYTSGGNCVGKVMTMGAAVSKASCSTATSTTVTVPNTANLAVGMLVRDGASVTNIPANIFIATIASTTTITISSAALTTTSGLTLTFYQAIQLPAPLTNTFYPGAWFETSAASGSYEFYPSANIAAAAATIATNATQGKLLYISVQGKIVIGNDGTNANGYIPAQGLNIRIPTILTSGTTKATTVGAYPHVAIPATITGRYSLVTTGGGVIDLNGINWAWNATIGQAYSLSLVNVAVVDGLGTISEIASPFTLTNVGIGTTGSGTNAVASFTFSLCFAGATFTDFIVASHVATSGTTAQIKTAITDCFNFSFSNFRIQLYPIRRSASSTCCTFTRCTNFSITGYDAIGARTDLITCSYVTFINSSYADLTSGTTTTTTPTYRWLLSTNTNNCTFSGDDFFGLANVNPYLGVYNIISATNNIKIRNIGSAATPLSLGPTNAAAQFLIGAANAGSQNIEIKRVYTSNTRTGIDSGIDNSYNKITYENCWFDAADTYTVASLNNLLKGMRATNVTTLQTAVYGSHFQDYFDSTTTGNIVIAGNEKTTVEPSASSYSVDVTGPTAGFNSTGAFYMPNISDQITWTHPYFVIGHKSFGTAVATETINAVTTNTNIDLFYDMDKGTSFSGTLKNLSYKRSGGGGTSGQATITMTSTTGVAVNDYVYGTGVGVAAKVNSIDTGTQITVSVNNSSTVSGVLKFNQIPNEASIDASVGIKLKVRAITNTAATSNLLQFIAIPTVTDATSQAYQYPLDLSTITLNNVVVGSRYEIYNLTSSTTLATGEASSSIVSVSAVASDGDNLRIRVRKSSGADPSQKYIPFETQATVVNLSASVFIVQTVDSVVAAT